MPLSDFQLLVVLAQESNMRKAAEKLFVSQPALSQRLQNIEKQWGEQLFIRTPKGLILTPAGELVVNFSKRVLEMEETVLEELQHLQSNVYGTLKIACASIVGQYWLPKVLKQYVKTYPSAKISLMTGYSSEILNNLYEGDVHVGIIRGNLEWKGEKYHLFSDGLYLVDREIQRVEDVVKTDRPFIQFKSDSDYYQEINNWWHRHFQSVPKQTIVVDQIETCKQMAFNGIGYAILPGITLHLSDQSIYKIPLKDDKGNPLKRDTWLVGYETSFQLRQVKAFLEIVKQFVHE